MRYDYLIVGGGISGLTVARLLSMQGATVLLVEKDAELGGSSKRFHLQGIPFDTGFHFTGGLAPDHTGLLDQMLNVLGIADLIEPVRQEPGAIHRLVFPFINATYLAPVDHQPLTAQLTRDFPRLSDGIRRYFQHFDDVVAGTPTLSVSGFDESPPPIPEDSITLQSVLDDCIADPMVQLILSSLGLCYGARPDEVSFATHARVCFGLNQSLARVRNGGQAFVDALEAALRAGGVEIRTNVALERCEESADRQDRHFVLSDGSRVDAAVCIFTIHPDLIVRALPQARMTKAFRQRVADYEPSIGFFALFGKIDEAPPDNEAFLTTTYPQFDLNQMMTYRGEEPVDGPMVVLRSTESVGAKTVEAVSALEVAFPQWTGRWDGSTFGRRPDEYYRYKQQRVERMVARLGPCLPGCADAMEVIDSASMLTFRDYLHNPDGAAYGIRQKLGQFNVFGRLPLTNCYAIGQSALLPGLLGAMTSAFLICRGLLGMERFREVIEQACP